MSHHRPLWVHFGSNLCYALVVGVPMVLFGGLSPVGWIGLSLIWGVIGIPITRRWEARGNSGSSDH
jgi:hypothetical protein